MPKGYQQVIELDPVRSRKFLPQHIFRSVRGTGRDISPPVAYAVNVGVDTDARLLKTERYYQVGSLAPYPFQLKELLEIIGNTPPILCDEEFAYLMDLFCFGSEESDRVNEDLEFVQRYLNHAEWSISPSEKSCRCFPCHSILCSKRKYA